MVVLFINVLLLIVIYQFFSLDPQDSSLHSLFSSAFILPLSLLLSVPRSVPPPTTVHSLNGFSAKVSWEPPTGDIRGLIDRYELKAYNRDQPQVPPIKAMYLANGNFTGKTHTFDSLKYLYI